MRLFNMLFKKKKKKPEFVDDIFGELDYTVRIDQFGKKKYSNNLKGKVSFGSVVVRIDLATDEKGPNKEQRDFFIRLNANFTSITIDKIVPLLEEELVKWLDEYPVKVDFGNEFVIHEISLPLCVNKPVCWSLTLYYLPISQFVTINFIDFTPQKGIAIDG